jgi:hypothetical protein
MVYQAASLNPDDLGQGGLFDALLTVKAAKFQHNTFTPTTGANAGQTIKNFEAKITYLKEDGNTADWTYSVGAGDSWNASDDGLSALPVREGGKLSASSAFGTFLQELVSAGFPKNRLTARLDSLYGVQFQSVGKTRKGDEDGKAVLVAKLVVKLPGEVAGHVGAAVNAPSMPSMPSMPVPPTPSKPAMPSVPTAPVAPHTNGTGDAGQLALTVALELGSNFTLQQVMMGIMANHATDANRDAAAGYVFTPQFTQLLQGAGYQVNGYTVSK